MIRRKRKLDENFEFPSRSKENPETSILRRASQDMVFLLQKWLQRRQAKPVLVQYNFTDSVRLLKLRVWELHYKVEIPEILDLIVPVLLKTRAPAKQSKKPGLGISVAALTGPGAEKILAEELRKRYPDGSHRNYWREQRREEDILRERQHQEGADTIVHKSKGSSLLYYRSVKEYQQQYDAQVEQEREEFNRAYGQKWRKRKRYRDNPWI
jgi:hypothetical protein